MPFYSNSSAGTVTYSNADWQTAGLITNGYIVDADDTGANLPTGGTDGETYRTPLSFSLGKYERALIRAKLDITYLAGDFRYKLTVPASTTAARIITRSSETPIADELAEVGALSTSTSGVAEVVVTADPGDAYILFEGFIEAGDTDGTVAIQFAQRDNQSADTVLNEGSYLEYMKF